MKNKNRHWSQYMKELKDKQLMKKEVLNYIDNYHLQFYWMK
jgi:hypothetical protein